MATHSSESLLRAAVAALATTSTSALLDAELLLAFVTGRTRTQLRSAPEHTPDKEAAARFIDLIERRRHGEPIAYLLGTREFWSLELKVNPSVLVPRPETELLVERALFHTARDAALSVLDLGTGSGAIALAIANERRASAVLATDVSAEALAVAQANARHLAITNVAFQLSDWYSALNDHRYDLIVSNPPYIADGDAELDEHVLEHEPHRALFAGKDGFEAIETIIEGAPRHLNDNGWLLLEHGSRQSARVCDLLEQAGFGSVASHADLAGIERVSEGRRLR